MERIRIVHLIRVAARVFECSERQVSGHLRRPTHLGLTAGRRSVRWRLPDALAVTALVGVRDELPGPDDALRAAESVLRRWAGVGGKPALALWGGKS